MRVPRRRALSAHAQSIRFPAGAATVVPTFSFGKGFKDACKKSYTESLKGSQLNGQEAPK